MILAALDEGVTGLPNRRIKADRNVLPTLSLFFDDLLDAKVREFNPRYAETKGELVSRFSHFQTNIYGNREFVDYLRNRGKFFDQEENRERDLILIDFDDPGNIKPSIQGGFRKKGLRIFPAYVHLKAKNHHCLINHLSLFLPPKGPCHHGNIE